jgi:hypothetical protein
MAEAITACDNREKKPWKLVTLDFMKKTAFVLFLRQGLTT